MRGPEKTLLDTRACSRNTTVGLLTCYLTALRLSYPRQFSMTLSITLR